MGKLWEPCACGKPSEHQIVAILPRRDGYRAVLYLCDEHYRALRVARVQE